MKNWNRVLFVLLAFFCAQIFGNVADAQCISAIDPVSTNVAATGAENVSFSVFSTPSCYWAPIAVESWINVESYYWSDSVSGGVTINVAANDFGEEAREGWVVLGDVNNGFFETARFTVFQAANCYVDWDKGPDAADSVFVARPDCDVVTEINISGTGTTVPAVVPDPNFEGVEYGPDGRLYVSDSGGGVYAVVPGTGAVPWGYYAATGFDPKNARFNSGGDLIVADGAGGLKAFENSTPVSAGINLGNSFSPVSDSSDFGGFVDVTTAVNGDLLGLTATSVVRFPYEPETGQYGPGTTLFGGLSATRAITRTSTNKIVVAAGSDLTVIAADGFSSWPCGSSFAGETVYGLESAANDTLYATLVNGNDGQLVEIPFITSDSSCGTPVLLATFTGAGGTSAPVYGVAVSFGHQNGVRVDGNPAFPAFAENTWAFSFNEQVYEITPELGIPLAEFEAKCDFEVFAQEVDPVYLQGLILDEPWGSSQVPIVYEGENGRGLVFDYNIFSIDVNVTYEQCKSYVTGLSHAINAYYSASSPTPVWCHDPGSGVECRETIFLSTSGFGYLPDDPRTKGGGGADFSFTFLEDKSGADPNYLGNFCGFNSSLEGTTELDPLIVNGGSTVPIGFTVSGTKNCKKGPFIDGIVAVLSVVRVDPFNQVDADDLVIVGGGSSEDDRIVFNVPVSSKKGYELQFKAEYADGTPFEAGATFELTVTDISGMYFPFETAFIKIPD
jgi:hypothetical protein